MNRKSVELDKYEQQIILACKNHSKLNLGKYEIVKNVIAHTIGVTIDEFDDHCIYYWLMKVIKKVDITLETRYMNVLLETMFSKDWIFSKTSLSNEITIQEMNKKLIQLIRSFQVKDDNFVFMDLHENNTILNTIYEEEK